MADYSRRRRAVARVGAARRLGSRSANVRSAVVPLLSASLGFGVGVITSNALVGGIVGAGLAAGLWLLAMLLWSWLVAPGELAAETESEHARLIADVARRAERAEQERDAARAGLAAQRHPEDALRNLNQMVVAGERLIEIIQRQVLETTEQHWREIDGQVEQFLALLAVALERDRPRRWLDLRDELAKPTGERLQPIQVTYDDGREPTWHMIGRGDRNEKRLKRALTVAREAIKE